MSHGIQIENGDITYGIEKHWHGLNKIAEKISAMLFEQVQLRRISFEPTLAEIQNTLKNGTASPADVLAMFQARSTGYSIPFQGERQIGIPVNPESYTVRSIHNLFDSVERALQGTEFKVESAGTLFGGTRYFISVSIPSIKSFKVGGEEVKVYLNWTGSLDKSTPETICISLTRVVCHNTWESSLFAANKASGQDVVGTKGKGKKREVSQNIAIDGERMLARMRHSKNMSEKIGAAEFLVNSAIGSAHMVKDQLQSLFDKPCSLGEAKAIYTGFLEGAHKLSDAEFAKLQADADALTLSTRRKNELAEVTTLFARGKGNKGETQYDLFNGLTEHYSCRSDSDFEDVAAKAKFVQSSTAGVYSQRKNEFLELLLDRPTLETTHQRGKLILDRSDNGAVGDILGGILAKPMGGNRLMSVQHA